MCSFVSMSFSLGGKFLNGFLSVDPWWAYSRVQDFVGALDS